MERKVALVTGASSGIGESTAQEMHKAGFMVYAAARRVQKMRPLAEAGMTVLEMDLTEDASILGGVRRIQKEHGRLDVLVNNAGYGSYGAVEDVPLSEARRQIEVNLFALARLSQLVIPGMREARSGRIINVSSMGGKFGEPLGAWYHAAKFAVEGFSDSLRMELAPFDIQVVVIEPGAIRTEWSRITVEHLLEASRGGAYSAQARRYASLLDAPMLSRRASPPSVIGRTILRAATARRPRTRYVVGSMAGTTMFMRRMLPDRTFDSLLIGMYERMSRSAAGKNPPAAGGSRP
ncbi:MAG: oxidoreductase [Spirochaetia bacterium]